MKLGLKIVAVLTVTLTSMSCRDKALEKRVAEVETQLAEMKKNNQASNFQPASVTPSVSTPAPAAETKPEGPLPIIEFDNTTFDFGKIQEGAKVTHIYKVKNTGQAPLIIQNAQPSCGCTVPEWTKEPIPVGGSGFVKAEFDSKGKTGMQDKSITVTANSWPKVTMLRFKAQVDAKPTGTNGPLK